MVKKRDASPPEHEELKRLLGRIGRRRAQKEKEQATKEKPSKNQSEGSESSRDE